MSGLLTDRKTRRAILLLLLTEFFWGMGTYFVLPTTTVPTYLRTLGAPPVILGVTYVALGALPMLLGLFGRTVIERFPHRKKGLIILHVVAIIPYLLVPLLDYAFAGTQNALLITAIIILLSLSQLTLGVIVPVWVDMIAQVVPPTARGRYFGLAAGALAVGGILGATALMGLQQWLGNSVFRGAFIATGICFMTGMSMFWMTPISETTFHHPAEPSIASRLRKAWSACHIRTNFGRFVTSNSLQVLAASILPFLIVYATDARGLHLPQGIFGSLTLLQALGGGVGALLLGWVVDHKGSRGPWIALTLFVPVILLLYPHGTIMPILVLCTLFVGILNSGWSVSLPALLEFAPDGDKSGYIAIANLIAVPSAMIGPLIMGTFIEGSSYTGAFLLAGLVGLLAFASALTIRGQHTRHKMVGNATVARDCLPIDGEKQ